MMAVELFNRIRAGARAAFGYHAVVDKGRRAAPLSTLKNEDAQLTSSDKSKLDMTAQDLPRNFELAAWALRLHVAYVSRFVPHVQTGSTELDALVLAALAAASRRERFDVAARHNRDRAMALFEIANVFYGDAAFIKTGDGRVQGVPGVRICKPPSAQMTSAADAAKWATVTSRGLILDKQTGAMVEAAVCRWKDNGTGLDFDHFEPARNLIFNGYFTDFDQSRGASPLSASINRCKDLMEALEYTNLKIKLHALFGLAFGTDGQNSPLEPNLDGDEATTTARPQYKVEPSQGLMVFNLRPGDKVDTVESKVPNSEFVDYTALSMRIALLAFDIPFTFLDSSKASFSARIADANQYEFLAAAKRQKNAEVLTEWSDWRLGLMAASGGELYDALRRYKTTAAEVAAKVEWVGAETPWIDKLAQLQGDQLGVALSTESIPRICRRRNVDWRKVIDENAAVYDYARSKGVPVAIGQPGQATAGAAVGDKPNADAQ